MTSSTRSASHPAVALIFTAAVFVNAALLFVVQPMFSKMALPLLGGTPAVWNTCMLFFQAALLGGYLYSHAMTRLVPARRQGVIHVGLLVLSGLTLPISVRSTFGSQPNEHPAAWLIAVLAVSLGAPFFMLSSGAPLLQRWFSRTGHRDAANPYFLYAASNLGSMIALLAYPAVIEPSLRTTIQSRLWSVAFVALVALIVACAFLARPRGSAGDRPEASTDVRVASDGKATSGSTTDGSLTLGRRLTWVLLAFIPSSMLLGVTTYLSTDVAAIPLLWVVPLATYLLTFVVAFSSRVWFRPGLILAVQAVFLLWLTITMSAGLSGLVRVMAPAHIAALFLSALVCHTRLAADRPPVERLTEFYLWISVGGMLGGVFNVLVAPNVFTTVAEYPIAIVLAAAVRPNTKSRGTTRAAWLDVLLPALLAVALWALLRNGFPIPGLGFRTSLAAFVACSLISLAFQRRRVRFALALAVIFAVAAPAFREAGKVLFRDRSFFGVYTVATQDGIRIFRHGTTTHGAQMLDPAHALEPILYYHNRGPIAEVFNYLLPATPRRVAIVGLGTGALSCFGRPGDIWTFYEIDPKVEAIARTTSYFTFMRDCAPEKQVVIGDARLALVRAQPASYNLIVLDAFTSDAVPTHLLTREALALYLEKLAPGGVVVFHISNRYLNLEPVVAGVAHAAGAAALLGSDLYLSPEERGPYGSASIWVAVAPSAESLAPLRKLRAWRPAVAGIGAPWTDDFSNVLGAFRR
jgi:spermidine synthase